MATTRVTVVALKFDGGVNRILNESLSSFASIVTTEVAMELSDAVVSV